MRELRIDAVEFVFQIWKGAGKELLGWGVERVRNVWAEKGLVDLICSLVRWTGRTLGNSSRINYCSCDVFQNKLIGTFLEFVLVGGDVSLERLSSYRRKEGTSFIFWIFVRVFLGFS